MGQAQLFGLFSWATARLEFNFLWTKVNFFCLFHGPGPVKILISLWALPFLRSICSHSIFLFTFHFRFGPWPFNSPVPFGLWTIIVQFILFFLSLLLDHCSSKPSYFGPWPLIDPVTKQTTAHITAHVKEHSINSKTSADFT
jgi:hypothetical protein